MTCWVNVVWPFHNYQWVKMGPEKGEFESYQKTDERVNWWKGHFTIHTKPKTQKCLAEPRGKEDPLSDIYKTHISPSFTLLSVLSDESLSLSFCKERRKRRELQVVVGYTGVGHRASSKSQKWLLVDKHFSSFPTTHCLILYIRNDPIALAERKWHLFWHSPTL